MTGTVQRSTGIRTALAALAAADVAFAFIQTAIIPAIPVVRDDLGMSRAWGAWLLSAYLMLATMATPALGRLADLQGRRRMLLISLGLFLLGAIGAALSPDMATLIVFRALQGVGGAVFPLTLAVLREHLPDDRVGVAAGVLTAAFGLGTALGFGLGGLIAQAVSWRLVFGAGAVLLAAATGLVALLVPGRPGTSGGRFDTLGTMQVGVAAIALLLALTLGVQVGWAAPPTIVLFVVAALLATSWVRHEMRTEDPLIDLGVLRTRAVTRANVATIGLGWALFASYLLVPEFVRAAPHRSGYGFHADAATAGLYLLPTAIGQMIAGPLAAWLTGRIPARRVFCVGLALAGGSLAVLATTGLGQTGVLAAVFVLGVGAGLAMQTSSAVVTADIAAAQAAVSSTVNSTVRRLAGGIGSQVSTAVLVALPAGATAAPQRAAFVAAFGLAAALALLGAGAVATR